MVGKSFGQVSGGSNLDVETLFLVHLVATLSSGV